MKNYYKILGVTARCEEGEIRKCYRKLAMQYHPDRNPDDSSAEEKFKEIAEAYGVLTDPVKRKEYDRCRKSGATFTSTHSSEGFSYSQEDILKDLFNDPRFQQMFSGLLKEFQRSGFRHSSQFIKRSFFRGKGSIFLGGIFFFGSLAGPLLGGAAKKSLSGKSSVIKAIGNKVTKVLGITQPQAPSQATPNQHPKDLDITYHTPLSAQELKHGKNIQVLVYGEQGEQTLKVKIPAGSHPGKKLRLRGKGRVGPLGRGDLFLELVEK